MGEGQLRGPEVSFEGMSLEKRLPRTWEQGGGITNHCKGTQSNFQFDRNVLHPGCNSDDSSGFMVLNRVFHYGNEACESCLNIKI